MIYAVPEGKNAPAESGRAAVLQVKLLRRDGSKFPMSQLRACTRISFMMHNGSSVTESSIAAIPEKKASAR
jgi:hypothetical protein